LAQPNPGPAYRIGEDQVRLAAVRSKAAVQATLALSLLCPPKRKSEASFVTSEKCHVWTAPGWQGESSRYRLGSVQPCVRPVSAAHGAAGHNALRGSGPGQNLAFKDAVARVGCPDRRIDRLCITCCSPSQPSHHAGYSARSRYGLSAAG